MTQYSCKCGETDPTNFYARPRTKCKKCHKDYQNNRYANFSVEDKSKYLSQQYEWQQSNIFQYRFTTARSRAYKRGLDFDITPEYLKTLYELQESKCYYSGIPFTDSKDGLYSISIDRIDSSKGYVKGNVVLAASIINSMKNDLSLKEFLTVVRTLLDYQESLVEP